MNTNAFTRFGSQRTGLKVDKLFLFLIENTIITNQDFDSTATLAETSTYGTITASPLMDMNITFSNYTITNVYSSGTKGIFENWLNNRTTITMKDVILQNVISTKWLLVLTDTKEITIQNLRIVNVTISDTHLFRITGTNYIDIDSIAFSSINLEGRYALDFAVIVSVFFLIP